jgi:hypothetical protein
MAVINSKYHRRNNAERCQLCGGWLQYPFLCWQGNTVKDGDINLCNRCCRKIKRGFTADLIHITATMDIHDLYPNAGTRLVHTTEERLDREGERQKREEEAVMLAFPAKVET